MALTHCLSYKNTDPSWPTPNFVGHFVAGLLCLGFLAGCATPKLPNTSTSTTSLPANAGAYRDAAGPGISCVPYARNESGIALRGDAFTWWDGAAGTYQRGQTPQPGAVLVLSKTSRLRSGHVAVVSQVLGSRQILVDHANWIPGRIITNMPVIDVSENNDWTALRFWYQPAQTYGDTYAAKGFIYTATARNMPDIVAPKATSVRSPAGHATSDGTIIISGSGVSVSP